MIQADQIKKIVREHYAARTGSASTCCSDDVGAVDCCAAEHAETLEGFVGPSLGCGSPLTHAELQLGETVCDLGSGAGREVLLAARQVGPDGRAIGVDMTPEMVWTARENARRAGLTNAEFRLGEIEHLPMTDGTADVVISNCVINLVLDKSRAFAEAYRILRRGGRLAVSDMVTHGVMPAEMRDDLNAWAGCIAGAVDVDEYVALIERAGFCDTEVLTQPGAAPGQVFSVTVRAYKS